MIFNNEILASIDEVGDVTLESMFIVYDNMMSAYEKMTNNDTCYVEGFVQEASAKSPSIMDQATGADKNESVIVKIIAFLPRLIMAVLKKAVSVFSGKDKKEIEKAPDTITKTVESASEEQLEQANEKLTQSTNGVVGIVPKRKRFIVRGFTHLKNSILLGATFPDLIQLISGAMKKKTFSWANLAKDVKSFYTQRGEIGKLLAEGNSEEEIAKKLTANFAGEEIKSFEIKDILSIITKSGFAASAIMSEAELFNNKKAWKQYTMGLDPTDAMHAESVCKTVKSVSFKMSFGIKLFQKLTGLVSWFKNTGNVLNTKDEYKRNATEALNDKFDRFIQSPEGEKYSGFKSYAEAKKNLKNTIGKGSKFKQFEEDFNKWIADHDEVHIKLPTQLNQDKAEASKAQDNVTGEDD